VIEIPRAQLVDPVWFRIAFPEWLTRISAGDRLIARSLALSES